MQLLKRLGKECLIALSVLVPTAVGLDCALGAPFTQSYTLDIQLHNTYFVLRPWELVLLISLPLWLLMQLARGIWYRLRRLSKPAP